jgi:hypothetical protein
VLFLLGLAWFFNVFFGFLSWMFSPAATRDYLEHLGCRVPVYWKVWKLLEVLAIGLGPWALRALLAPRTMILALPWFWSLVSGLWTFDSLTDERWTQVRYAAPGVSMLLAAGLIGFSGLAVRLGGRRWRLVGVWAVLLCGLLTARASVVDRLARIPPPIPPADAPEIWRWIDRVRPDEGVLTSYRLSGPLSSRRWLYVYNMFSFNLPPGYPSRVSDRVAWLFWETRDGDPSRFTADGFEPVARTRSVSIYRRRRPPAIVRSEP